MKQPDLNGGLAAKSLYSFDTSNETENNIAKPTDNYNLFGRPSLTPGVEYPISDKEEKILDKGYKQGYEDAMRLSRAGHVIEDAPFLNLLRKRVEEIRKEKIINGQIKPVNKRERKWSLGL